MKKYVFNTKTPPINKNGIIYSAYGKTDISKMSISNGEEKARAYIDENGLHWKKQSKSEE